MSDELPPNPPSPGVGVGFRRKDPKNLPKLPLAAFSPPSTGNAEGNFPVPPSPGASHSQHVVDGHVVSKEIDLGEWKKSSGEFLADRIGGVVISLQGQEPSAVHEILSGQTIPTGGPEIVSIGVPFRLEEPAPASKPAYLTSKIPIFHATAYTAPTEGSVAALRWALEQGLPVDIDIQADINGAEKIWEDFVDLLNKATADLDINTPIILSNILPPPRGMSFPIVKLMNHPAYRAYQDQMAALSLFPNVYIKYIPPAWETTVPVTGGPTSLLLPRAAELIASQTPITAIPMITPSSASPAFGLGGNRGDEHPEIKQLNEWKRRIKMYLGPVLEAFGYSRIIYGSSPSPSAKASNNSIPDWYELARECLAELGSSQEAVDMVFGLNAKKVYGNTAPAAPVAPALDTPVTA